MTTSNTLAMLLAKAAERKKLANASLSEAASAVGSVPSSVPLESIPSEIQIRPIQESVNSIFSEFHTTLDGKPLNAKQSEFVALVSSGRSCVLVGAAGTGKTTCTKAAIQSLIHSGRVPAYTNDGHKHLANATHGILICAYTRRAVANIKKGMPADLQASCITVHAALEYAPEYFDVQDPVTGDYKTTMRFSPTRNKLRPIDDTVRFCFIEESSMLGLDLFNELKDALHPSTVFVFLGDIQQLPPVFGSAILGFKMLELPVIELTEVYRQALDSPIISLAHRILSGKAMSLPEMQEWNEKYSDKGLQFHPIKKKTHPEHILPKIANFFKKEISLGKFNIETDTILCPFNKGLGTLELNKEIAQYLTEKRNQPTYEIISGFNYHYFAIGDKVLYEKEDAEIISINHNSLYIGSKIPKQASMNLDRWGYDRTISDEIAAMEDDFQVNLSPDQIDSLLTSMSSEEAAKERKNEASHVITVRMAADGEEISLSKSSEINQLLLGYALTVHKSQGSEYNKVYLLLHTSHATMTARELLYTGVTRAKKELYIICERDTFEKGIERQKVPGDTLAEKAEHFKGKLARGEN